MTLPNGPPSASETHDQTTCPQCRADAEANDSTAAQPTPHTSHSVPLRLSFPGIDGSFSNAYSRPASPPSPTTLEHRRTDAERRQREKSAVRRLDELSAEAKESTQHQQQPSAADSLTAPTARQKRKRDKLSVLEASAARIERLEQLLVKEEQSNQVLSAEISNLVARERLSMQWQDASKSLDCAGLLSDRFLNTLFCARSGRLLHANARFFTESGFTPGGVLHRVVNRLDPSSPTGHKARLADSEYPLVRARGRRGSGELTEWVTKQMCKQFPATIQLFDDLFSGRRSTINVAIRCLWASRQLTYTHALLRGALCGCRDAHFSSAVVLCHCRLCCVLWQGGRAGIRAAGRPVCGGVGVGGGGGWHAVAAAGDIRGHGVDGRRGADRGRG